MLPNPGSHRAIVWHKVPYHTPGKVWHKRLCHTMAQGPCHTPKKVWHKRPCHTMAQVPCHTLQRPSQAQLLYPVPYLPSPAPYPYHTLATLTSAEHILFPHPNHTRAIPVPDPRESRSRAGRTAQPLKQQQTLQSSRRLESQSSFTPNHLYM